jgi:hypothetical protein
LERNKSMLDEVKDEVDPKKPNIYITMEKKYN